MDPNEGAPLKKRKIIKEENFKPKPIIQIPLPPNFQFNKLRTNPTDPSASSKPNTSASLTTNTNKSSEQPTQLSIVAEEKLTTTTTITNNNNTNNNSNNKFVSSVSEQNVSSSQKDDDVSGTDHESSENSSEDVSTHAMNHIPSDGEAEEHLTNYPDSEIEELWRRLTDSNKLLALKSLLRKHPEEISILYKLADTESNIIENIQSEFQVLQANLQAAVKPDADVMDKLDPNYEDPSRREKYRHDLENRKENPDLDGSVKATFGFIWKVLDTCREYFQAGKISAAVSMFTTTVNLYIHSNVCKEGYADPEEEHQLAQRLLKCLLCCLDSEQPKPTLSLIKELFAIVDSLIDNFNDENVRENFMKKYREIKRNYIST